jgi:hypothetical protein
VSKCFQDRFLLFIAGNIYPENLSLPTSFVLHDQKRNLPYLTPKS